MSPWSDPVGYRGLHHTVAVQIPAQKRAYGPWLAPFGSREARAVNAFLRASQSKHLTLSPFNNVLDLDVDIRLGSVTLEVTGLSFWVVLL